MGFIADSIEPTNLREYERRLLLPYQGNISRDLLQEQLGILYSLRDYLQFVDNTGRTIRKGKRGAIDNDLPPILSRLGISSSEWLQNSQRFEQLFRKKLRRRPIAA